MKDEENEKEFNVCVLVYDHVIQDQREKQDGNSDECDQDGLGEFTQPGFPEYFAVRSDQRIDREPEKRDDGDPVIQFFIQEYVIEMAENLVVHRVLAINEEQRPGYESRDKIGSNIFDYL